VLFGCVLLLSEYARADYNKKGKEILCLRHTTIHREFYFKLIFFSHCVHRTFSVNLSSYMSLSLSLNPIKKDANIFTCIYV